MLSGLVGKDALSGLDLDDSSQSDPLSNEGWGFLSEEENWQLEDDAYWDTDNEAEESNAIDRKFI